MTTIEIPSDKSNALILEFIIQSLCQEDSLAKLSRLKAAYTQQLTKLSSSLITHIKICYDFGYIQDDDLPIYIKLIKDQNLDSQELEKMELNGASIFKNRTSQSGELQILDTVKMMLGTIDGLRGELKNFEEIEMGTVEIKRPDSSLWLSKAYAICLAIQANEHHEFVIQQIGSLIDEFRLSAKLTAWQNDKLKSSITEQVV